MVGKKVGRRAHPMGSEGEGNGFERRSVLSMGLSRGPIDSPEFPKLQRSVPRVNVDFAPSRTPYTTSPIQRFRTHPLRQSLQPGIQRRSISLKDLHSHSAISPSAFQNPFICSRHASSSGQHLPRFSKYSRSREGKYASLGTSIRVSCSSPSLVRSPLWTITGYCGNGNVQPYAGACR